MRAYFFGNFYLSSIQQGIQAAHVVGEMSYLTDHNLESQYRTWVISHKTMILLNGGMASNLLDIEELFSSVNNDYCWASFREETDALNQSITSVGIILPEKIYQAASDWRQGLIDPTEMVDFVQIQGTDHHSRLNMFSDFEIKLMDLMNSCRLAS